MRDALFFLAGAATCSLVIGCSVTWVVIRLAAAWVNAEARRQSDAEKPQPEPMLRAYRDLYGKRLPAEIEAARHRWPSYSSRH